jgi:CAAX protease family protein
MSRRSISSAASVEPPADANDPNEPIPAFAVPPPPPEAPPWPANLPVWALLLIVVATLVAYVVVQSSLQLVSLGLALWFTEVFVFLAVPWLLARFREEHPLDVARARWPGWAPLGWGAALGVANLFGAAVPLQFVSQKLFPKSVVELFDQGRLFERQDTGDLVLLFAAVAIAAPLCEEMYFRGFLQERLTRVMGAPWRVAVFVALVFSAFHLDPVGFLARFELGLLFGLLYWRTGSLWPGVMAHAANNITSTVLFAWSKDQGTQDEDPDVRSVLLLGAIGLTAVAILLRFALRAKVRPAPPARRYPLTTNALWPWPVAAALSIGSVVALDFRGVRLNLIDARVSVPAERRDADEHEEQLRDELFQLRSKARRGQASLDEYEAKRKEAAELLRLRDTGDSKDSEED